MRGLWFVNECITVSSFLFFVFCVVDCFIKKVRGPFRPSVRPSVRPSDPTPAIPIVLGSVDF
jgi:hypothetical protein